MKSRNNSKVQGWKQSLYDGISINDWTAYGKAFQEIVTKVTEDYIQLEHFVYEGSRVIGACFIYYCVKWIDVC